MKTALIFTVAIFCGLTLCARKHAHLDYKTTDIAYPLRHKEYFDLKYKTSGVADPWRHKKYIDLEERSSEAADPWRHKKHIDLEDTASDSRNYTHVHVRCFIRVWWVRTCRRFCFFSRCCRWVIYYIYRYGRYYFYRRRCCSRCCYTVVRRRICSG